MWGIWIVRLRRVTSCDREYLSIFLRGKARVEKAFDRLTRPYRQPITVTGTQVHWRYLFVRWMHPMATVNGFNGWMMFLDCSLQLVSTLGSWEKLKAQTNRIQELLSAFRSVLFAECSEKDSVAILACHLHRGRSVERGEETAVRWWTCLSARPKEDAPSFWGTYDVDS